MKKKIQIIKQVNLNYNKDILGINSKLIDCMSVLAAWCVLLGHCFSSFSVTIFKDEEKFFYIQNIAVIIFFTLAGFLMVYSLNSLASFILLIASTTESKSPVPSFLTVISFG